MGEILDDLNSVLSSELAFSYIYCIGGRGVIVLEGKLEPMGGGGVSCAPLLIITPHIFCKPYSLSLHVAWLREGVPSL